MQSCVTLGRCAFSFGDTDSICCRLCSISIPAGVTHRLVREYLLQYGYADTLRAFDTAAGTTEDVPQLGTSRCSLQPLPVSPCRCLQGHVSSSDMQHIPPYELCHRDSDGARVLAMGGRMQKHLRLAIRELERPHQKPMASSFRRKPGIRATGNLQTKNGDMESYYQMCSVLMERSSWLICIPGGMFNFHPKAVTLSQLERAGRGGRRHAGVSAGHKAAHDGG